MIPTRHSRCLAILVAGMAGRYTGFFVGFIVRRRQARGGEGEMPMEISPVRGSRIVTYICHQVPARLVFPWPKPFAPQGDNISGDAVVLSRSGRFVLRG
jgi:hypothetical protein